ncbi:hypothetical protein ABB37_09457 [Leptomonas pyrrhocoris]|uniref:Uncharacterized protein n=1 Tax=Leptomonas pyrrhocoris TaxID=157538 RepID=A0A0M9FQZ7_LEPPY|nr:hypothetical protein ABB37_09457 [Leptomonas pyrrhocoris]KPA74203.1 hypothetical protein ABB37_09457 [Leptomonas pyrrhocoris]|eukprot:XP_015652642.1 hypothetical protein ABB37_09457 [Leptomonas pyrrhocoris]
MFRWTAGTKARADRAARQHGLGGGPGRLLLASRPLHTAPRSCASPLATKAKAEPRRAPSGAHKTVSDDLHETRSEIAAETERGAPAEEANRTQKQATSDVLFTTTTRESQTAVDAAASLPEVQQQITPPPTAAACRPPSLSEERHDETLCSPHASTATCVSSPVLTLPLSLPPSRSPQAPPANAAKNGQPFVSLSSRSHADRLVRAMMNAAQNERKRRRGHDRGSHSHHHSRVADFSGKTSSIVRGDPVDGDASETDVCSVEQGSSSRSSSVAHSLASETAMDTYGVLQRLRQRVEAEERQQHRLPHSESIRPAETVRGKSHRYATKQHNRNDAPLQATKHCSSIRGSTYAAPPPVVSVDCVSVQLPLRGRAQTPSYATSSWTTSTVTAAGSTSCPRVEGQRRRPASFVSSQQQPASANRVDGVASVKTWCSRSTGGRGEWTSIPIAQGGASWEAGVVEVAVDAQHHHRPERGNNVSCSISECGESVVPVDMSLFQEAAAVRTGSFSSDPFKEMGSCPPMCFPGGTDQLNSTRDAPSVNHFDFDDRPLDWSPQQASAFQDASHFAGKGRQGTHLWAMPLAEAERWAGGASSFSPYPPTRDAVSPEAIPSNWPLPPAASTSAKCFAWNTERGAAADTPGLEVAFPYPHTVNPACTPPSSFLWLPSSSSPQNANTADVCRYESRELPEYGEAWPSAAAALTSASSRGIAPWAPAPPRHGAHPHQRQPWFSQDHPPQPQKRMSPFPLFVPQPQHNAPNPTQARITGRAAQRGGVGQQRRQQRQAPPRALNGTTERCRRFWERCRHPPDVHQPHPSPFD